MSTGAVRPATAHPVVVVGGGPAGMAAARAAAAAGAAVLLVDSGAALGGQYHRQNSLGAGREFALPAGVEHLAESQVWALEPVPGGHRLHIRTGPADSPERAGRTVDTPALVLATGAYDRALPFPGWELPGVFTAGAAQALAKGQGVAVGERVLLAGTGPFLLPVAEALTAVGSRVAGILEAGDPVTGWLAAPDGIVAGRRRLAELARYTALLARRRIPYHRRSTVIEAHGTELVEAVTVARLDARWRVLPGSERRVEVDAVCVGFGFTPQLELAVAARCALAEGFVSVDIAQATSVAGVYAAGELTGIGGAELAAAEGEVAGAAAAVRLLGRRLPPPVRALRRVREGRRFAAALGRAYPVRDGWRTWLRDDTVLCRCEEVSCGELRRAVAERDALGVRSVKLVSRAGLGLCQGRVCGRAVAELSGLDDPGAAFARRPIAAPIRLGELAETPLEPPQQPTRHQEEQA